MSEKVNWFKHEHTWLGFAIIELMSLTSTDSGKDFIETFFKGDEAPKKGEGIDIELKINGVECSFVKLVEFMEGQHNRMIHEKATALIRNKMIDIREHMDVLSDKIEEELKSFLEDGK